MTKREDFPERDKYGERYRRVEKTSSWVKAFTSKLRKNITAGLWNIVFTKHGEKRMVQREVSPHEVREILLSGRWKESRLYETRSPNERHVFRGHLEDDKKFVEVVFVVEAHVIVVTVWSEMK